MFFFIHIKGKPADAFGSKPQQQQPQGPPKFSFGMQPPTTTPASTQPSIDNVFGAKAGLSFADLAGASKPFGFSGGFGSASASGQTLFGQAKPPQMLFGQSKPAEDDEEGGNENQNPEEYEPQVDFKPLVKLSEVEVKTGEEDEDIVFKQRCKLYRFDNNTKEWKEKGTGELKILRHKLKEGYYRVLMRRDQVLKICANHKISADIKLETVNEKQLRWLANDCSEGEAHPELLAVRFRNEDDAQQFRAEFEKAQASSKTGAVAKAAATTATQQPAVKNSLASLVKKGDWSCAGCYAMNKETDNKCACCEAPKPHASSTDKANDNGKYFYGIFVTQFHVLLSKCQLKNIKLRF